LNADRQICLQSSPLTRDRFGFLVTTARAGNRSCTYFGALTPAAGPPPLQHEALGRRPELAFPPDPSRSRIQVQPVARHPWRTPRQRCSYSHASHPLDLCAAIDAGHSVQAGQQEAQREPRVTSVLGSSPGPRPSAGSRAITCPRCSAGVAARRPSCCQRRYRLDPTKPRLLGRAQLPQPAAAATDPKRPRPFTYVSIRATDLRLRGPYQRQTVTSGMFPSC
jgi:hypothetical protein